jgi:hypothetical protein
MSAEDHPLYRTWDEALARLVEAERRYHVARMEGQPEGEVEQAARALDEARRNYEAIDEQIEEYDAPRS